MKRKILSILLVCILMISLTGCGSTKIDNKIDRNIDNNIDYSNDSTNNTSKSSTVKKIKCTKNNDMKRTVELVVENNELITKTFIVSWDNKDQYTCDFFKSESQKHDSLNGISDSTDCNSTSGTRKAIFTLSEIDKKETYLPETKYIGSNQEFDINGYKSYMENDDYSCVEE